MSGVVLRFHGFAWGRLGYSSRLDRHSLAADPYRLLSSTKLIVDQGFVDEYPHINPAILSRVKLAPLPTLLPLIKLLGWKMFSNPLIFSHLCFRNARELLVPHPDNEATVWELQWHTADCRTVTGITSPGRKSTTGGRLPDVLPDPRMDYLYPNCGEYIETWITPTAGAHQKGLSYEKFELWAMLSLCFNQSYELCSPFALTMWPP